MLLSCRRPTEHRRHLEGLLGGTRVAATYAAPPDARPLVGRHLQRIKRLKSRIHPHWNDMAFALSYADAIGFPGPIAEPLDLN